MIPLVPLALSVVPALARWLIGPAAGDTAQEVAAVVRQVTGTPDPEQAAAALNADPARMAELQIRLAEIAANREAAQAGTRLEEMRALLAADATQAAINLAAAQSSDPFASRWRPAVGWVCVAALAWCYVLGPIAKWALIVSGANVPLPPTAMDASMGEIVFAALGMGGWRTLDKMRGATK